MPSGFPVKDAPLSYYTECWALVGDSLAREEARRLPCPHRDGKPRPLPRHHTPRHPAECVARQPHGSSKPWVEGEESDVQVHGEIAG
jgi:hypothetical protein